jgi:D-alanyl-D-alanine carboxypeptidase
MRVLAALAVALLAGAAPPSRSELQRGVDELVRTSDIPGVIALVEEDGRRTVVAAGLADRARRRQARPTDRFWAGSITKSFVAVTVMQLVAEGRLRLDDTVARRLPGRLRHGARIRIRNLLNHTSGLPEYMARPRWRAAVTANPRAVVPARSLVSSVADLPLDFQPGGGVAYSNTNYLVLGEIVERVTRRPLAHALRTRIIQPLRLTSTSYEPGTRRLDARQMHGYDTSAIPPVDVSRHGLGGPWADGAIVSNARDLAVFFGAILRGRLVPKRLLGPMLTIVPKSHGEGMGIYRLGSPCGRFFWGHTGGTPGNVTFAAGTRDGRKFFVLSINGVGGDAIPAMGRFLDDELLC